MLRWLSHGGAEGCRGRQHIRGSRQACATVGSTGGVSGYMRSRGGWAVNRRIALVSMMIGLAGFWLLIRPLHASLRDNISSTVVFVLGAWLTARPSAQGRFLPLARTVVPALGPVLAGLVLG